MKKQKILGIIPARYGSTRFEGKPLVLIKGKPMIQLVYEQVMQVAEIGELIVATDDQRIADVVLGFGGNICMTNLSHKSGTDRCGEVLKKKQEQGEVFDVVVNIQGDEPQINPETIRALIACFEQPEMQIATSIKEINSEEDLYLSSVVKCVKDKNGRALYFSRSPIPFMREKTLHQEVKHYKHLGIYAFRGDVLEQLVLLPPSSLEAAEALEQLRWLENGFSIQTCETPFESISIDTPEDLKKL